MSGSSLLQQASSFLRARGQLFQTSLGYSPFKAVVRILAWMAMPMIVASIAGASPTGSATGPSGARPAAAGAGLGWLAAVVEPGVGYSTLVGPLVISGIRVAMCFPTVANAVVEAVPIEDVGVAARVNSSLCEVGGVFGIALMAPSSPRTAATSARTPSSTVSDWRSP